MGVEWRLGEVGDLRRVAPSPPGTQDCSLLLLPLVPLGSDKLVEVSRPCQPRCGGPESSYGPGGGKSDSPVQGGGGAGPEGGTAFGCR